MALIEKLEAIADGFRSSRGLTEKISLDDMARLSLVPVKDTGSSMINKEYVMDKVSQTLDLGIDYTPSHIIIISKNSPDYSAHQAFMFCLIDIEHDKKYVGSRQAVYGTLMLAGGVKFENGIITLTETYFINNILDVIICKSNSN